MSSWNVQETRDLIQRLYGRKQMELARPSLRSIVDRQNYVRIHFHAASDLLADFVARRLQTASLLEVLFDRDDEEDDGEDNFQEFITKIGAYSTACWESMHAVADILAHAVYFSLAMNLDAKPLGEKQIDMNSVKKRMAGHSELAAVQGLMEEFSTSGDFAHLAAMANHGKHRHLNFPALSEDQTGQAAQRHTVRIAAFTYSGAVYPEVDLRSFLEKEYNRCSRLVIDIGNALNAVLQDRAQRLPA